MARNPGADNDGIRPVIRQREKVRALRIRPHAHTESKTFIIGAAIVDGMDIPPFKVGINADDNAPEWKYLYSVICELTVGSCTVDWLVNGSSVWSQAVTTVSSEEQVAPAIELAHGDRVTVLISDASVDASGLSACAVMVTSPS